MGTTYPILMSIKDGHNYTIFDDNDFFELVEKFMGTEAKQWLDCYVSQLNYAADYTAAKIDTDLSNYEASLDSNTTAFQDIQAEVRAIEDLLLEKRLNRQKIIAVTQQIHRIINNQI